MPGLLPDVDPNGLLEYSVVYTDRAVNHMSAAFQAVMTDISAILKLAYNAEAVAIIPGSGTFGMEAVARQFATGKKCLVIRNGLFSFRWSQILDVGDIPSSSTVFKARKIGDNPQDPFAPAAIDDVVRFITEEQPEVVFAPHVETSSGMLLPDSYLRQITDAVHDYDGLFVLDCIASGAIWIDMQAIGVDVLISAPQKGWSGSPCAAFVMMNKAARDAALSTPTSSFACDLGKWLEIMQAYENSGHAYHATLPTDALTICRDVMKETASLGFDKARARQQELGDRVRDMLSSNGFCSVAAPGFEAPSVVVCYTKDPDISSGRKFATHGMQIAAGVPLMCDEPNDFRSFRIGLFGLDKMYDIERTIASLETVLGDILTSPDNRENA